MRVGLEEAGVTIRPDLFRKYVQGAVTIQVQAKAPGFIGEQIDSQLRPSLTLADRAQSGCVWIWYGLHPHFARHEVEARCLPGSQPCGRRSVDYDCIVTCGAEQTYVSRHNGNCGGPFAGLLKCQ